MFKIKKTVLINAPVVKVCEYMKDPAHLPEFWPSMLEVKNIRKNAKGWPIYEWVYKMAGMKFDGESDTTEFIENAHTTTESTKGIKSHFDFDYKDLAGKTELTVTVEYTVPIPLIGKLAEGVIGKMNDHDADTMLANLKARMEE